MSARRYIVFDHRTSDNPSQGGESAARQIKQAAFHLLETRRLLRLAQRSCDLGYSAWTRLDALAAACHQLLEALEEL
jgi:hypothetical protein